MFLVKNKTIKNIFCQDRIVLNLYVHFNMFLMIHLIFRSTLKTGDDDGLGHWFSACFSFPPQQ